MIIIFGTRYCGVVDSCEGERAATRFAHCYWMPLFPVGGTRWLVPQRDGGYVGHSMRFSWRSVLAAYLRSWGALIGVLLLVATLRNGLAIGPMLVGASLLAASIYSWRWYRTSAEEEAHRRLFAAWSGSYCAPEHLVESHADALLADAERLWAQRYPGAPPDDVARFGTGDAEHAALAYAIIRLRERRAGQPLKEKLRELADAIARSEVRDTLPGDGPYRRATG